MSIKAKDVEDALKAYVKEFDDDHIMLAESFAEVLAYLLEKPQEPGDAMVLNDLKEILEDIADKE